MVQKALSLSSNIKEIVKASDWRDFVGDYPNLVRDILNDILMIN
jgi:hypothetical protein